jgi:transcriptional regulator with XRE-family HTH domain
MTRAAAASSKRPGRPPAATASVNGQSPHVPAAAGRESEMPLGVWLRQQREARSWSRKEQARRLIQAGRDVGDTSMPSVDSMYHNINRWERGDNEPTERYKLYYGKTFEVPVTEFTKTPSADSLSQIAMINAHGLSVSLHYVSGRLVIDISGLETWEGEPDAGPGLSLVTSQDPPSDYGGRA